MKPQPKGCTTSLYDAMHCLVRVEGKTVLSPHVARRSRHVQFAPSSLAPERTSESKPQGEAPPPTSFL